MQEFERDGKWTVRVGDNVKVDGNVPESVARYYPDGARLGFTGTVMRFSVERGGKVIAHVTEGTVPKGKKVARKLRSVNAERITKTNRP